MNDINKTLAVISAMERKQEIVESCINAMFSIWYDIKEESKFTKSRAWRKGLRRIGVLDRRTKVMHEAAERELDIQLLESCVEGLDYPDRNDEIEDRCCKCGGFHN